MTGSNSDRAIQSFNASVTRLLSESMTGVEEPLWGTALSPSVTKVQVFPALGIPRLNGAKLL